MIALVSGAADWEKTRRILAHLHERFAFTGLLGDNQLAKRWAMESGVRFQEMSAFEAINRRPTRLISFPGDAILVEMARQRAIKVVEIV